MTTPGTLLCSSYQTPSIYVLLETTSCACVAACVGPQCGDVAAVADLGGSIITGIDGNPLAVLAKQLDIRMHDISSDDVPLYMRDGSQLDQAVDMQVRANISCNMRVSSLTCTGRLLWPTAVSQ